MQFTSVAYLVLLALAAVAYFALPGPRSRTAWLLAVSYGFYYSLSARWTVLLAAITMLGYVAGRLLEPAGTTATGTVAGRRRLVLGVAIATAAASLVVLKYTGFATGLLNDGLSLAGASWRSPVLRFALPVGISFWTFQTIAYLVDVARGTIPAERDLARYALFVSFFPQVAAGPIPRGGQLLPQLSEKHRFSYEGMRSGLLLVLWGFAKKLLVADALGVFVGQVFGDPHRFASNGAVALAACLAFSIQIYCDFSGYTDIARGSARLFGVELVPNFERPYESRSVKEFWRRWHMSLMNWLRDYVYFPLGGSRVPTWRRYANVMLVFLFSGLWHGAGLTFVVWGALNGAYQIAGDATAPARDRLARTLRLSAEGLPRRVLATASTFALITIAWVFFRAASLSDALLILRSVATLRVADLAPAAWPALALTRAQVSVTLLAAAVVFAGEHLAARTGVPALLERSPVPLRWAAYVLAIVAVVVFGRYGMLYRAADFAYFKF